MKLEYEENESVYLLQEQYLNLNKKEAWQIDQNIYQRYASEIHGFRKDEGIESVLVSLLDKVKDLKWKNKKTTI